MKKRIITITMKVSAPADVNPGALFEWLTHEIERWHPNNPLSVEMGAATVPAKRGPKETIDDELKNIIQGRHEIGFPIAQIARDLKISRGIVQRTLKAATN